MSHISSEINLVTRPKQTKERSRPNSAFSAYNRRPESSEVTVTTGINKNRPYSADSPITSILRPKSANKLKLDTSKQKNDVFDDINRKLRNYGLRADTNKKYDPMNEFSSAKLLESLLSEPVVRSWDGTEINESLNSESPKTNSDDSLGTQIKSLAKDNIDITPPDIDSEYLLPSTSRGLYGKSNYTNIPTKQNVVTFSENIETLHSISSHNDDKLEEESQYDRNNYDSRLNNGSSISHNNELGNSNGATDLNHISLADRLKISPGLTKKPPLPYGKKNYNEPFSRSSEDLSQSFDGEYLSQSNISLALSINEHHNRNYDPKFNTKQRFSSECTPTFDKDPSFRAWTERKDDKKDISGRVSFYKESSIYKGDVLEEYEEDEIEVGDASSIEDESINTSNTYAKQNLNLSLVDNFPRFPNYNPPTYYGDKPEDINQIIEDYKREVANINSLHDHTKTDIRDMSPNEYKELSPNRSDALERDQEKYFLETNLKNNSEGTSANHINCTGRLNNSTENYLEVEIDEHFDYLNTYDNESIDDGVDYDSGSDTENIAGNTKCITPEIVEIRANPTNLSKYLENESQISQEGVITDYRIAIGEVQKPNRQLAEITDLITNDLNKKTNELFISMAEINDSSTEVIKKYLKVKQLSETEQHDNVYELKSLDSFKYMKSPPKSKPINVANSKYKGNKSKQVKINQSRKRKEIPVQSKRQSLEQKIAAIKSKKFSSDDIHISEVKNDGDIESWMSQSIDCCQNGHSNIEPLEDIIELPEHDCHIDEEYGGNCGDGDGHMLNSTYNEIVSILEEIENEDDKTMYQVDSLKKDVHDKMKSFSKTNISSQFNNVPSSAKSTSTKYKDILCYLDEVDMDCDNVLDAAKSRIKDVQEFHIKPDSVVSNSNYDDLPKLHDLISLSTSELAHMVISLSVQLHERTCCVELLNDALAQRRAQHDKDTRAQQKQHTDKLRAQKLEYEGIVKRHQKFIDQLIMDKKSISAQCEKLISEMRATEERYTNTKKAMEQRHEVEMQRTKDMLTAAEKIRREKWIDTKTQKIKEMTVKGLETEINTMTARHTAELADLRSKHELALIDAVQKNTEKMQRKIEKERDELSKERERALQRERERFEQQLECEQKSMESLRVRLKAELALEKQRVNEVVKSLRDEINELEKKAEQERLRAVELAEKDWHQNSYMTEQKHQTEIEAIEHTLTLELESHKATLSKQHALAIRESEREIREACKLERDRQIERVIENIEQEAQEAKRQMQKAMDNRIRRQKEKYESEINEIENSERNAKERLMETKQLLSETEEMNITLNSNLKQLELHLQHTQKICKDLTDEREHVRERVQMEFCAQITGLQSKMEDMRKEQETEMQQVYARVKLAVAKKDSSLQLLQAEHQRLLEKCSVLEKTIQEQRKQYYILK